MGEKHPATKSKGANFFSEINPKFCKHIAKQNFQITSPGTALNLSRSEGHG